MASSQIDLHPRLQAIKESLQSAQRFFESEASMLQVDACVRTLAELEMRDSDRDDARRIDWLEATSNFSSAGITLPFEATLSNAPSLREAIDDARVKQARYERSLHSK